MPAGPKRYQNSGHLHDITMSCDRRELSLADAAACEVVETIFEEIRGRHELHIYAYVLMPEHLHMLVNEPPRSLLRAVMQVMKQESAKKLKGNREQFWQVRYYDFNIFSGHKFDQKIDYIHNNPVARGLVTTPEDRPWSSARHYSTGLPGAIEIESWSTQQARNSPKN